MTRRIVRAGFQLGVIATIALVLIFFLDNRYNVLPTSIHNHLPAHHPGFVVTDVEIVSCSTLNPFSKCSKDGAHWHKINKDLYLGAGFLSKAYLFVERKKEEDLVPHDDIVFDIKVGRSAPETAPEEKLAKDQKWESRQSGIWIKRSARRHMGDAAKAITGVDVLFGVDAADPRSNWQLSSIPLRLDVHGTAPEAFLTMRKGPATTVDKPVPRIRKDGKFKIMQAADLHLATGPGKCRDALPAGSNAHCEADTRTLEFVERMIEDEQPDFVVLSGDQVNGDTAPDAQSPIFKYSALFARHKIPYAGIFGNHDDEGNLDRAESMAIMDGLPYSLSTAGPEDVEGVGNYIVEVMGRGSSAHSALTLYFLDTHSYSPDERHYHGYDWLKESQITWFKDTAKSLKRKHEQYTHIHMDLAFIHIPLPEYRNPHHLQWVGNWTENPTAPAYNTNFHDALVEENVLMVSCGHDHVNDYCLPGIDNQTKKPALWMCYGGGAGFGGYGGYYGYHRRIRFFEFDMDAARIKTWKRMEWGDTDSKIDEQLIVDGGKVVVD